MFQSFVQKAQDRLKAIRIANWRQKSDDFWGWVWNSLLSLDPPKDPSEVDAILLEDRILYSATPFPFIGDGAPVDAAPDSVPEGFSPDEWSSILSGMEQFAFEHGFGPAPASQSSTEVSGLAGVPEQSEDSEEPLYDATMLEAKLGGVLDSSNGPLPLDTTADQVESTISIPEVSASKDFARHEVVFVQAGLTDVETLLSDLSRDTLGEVNYDVVLLDQIQDGFDQIEQALAAYHDLDAIHFVSHGTDGMIPLGGSWLTAGDLQNHLADMQHCGIALSDAGDILIYGCDVAAGPDGPAFIDRIAELTHADVSASIDNTGDMQRGGDWKLEYIAERREHSISSSYSYSYSAQRYS